MLFGITAPPKVHVEPNRNIICLWRWQHGHDESNRICWSEDHLFIKVWSQIVIFNEYHLITLGPNQSEHHYYQAVLDWRMQTISTGLIFSQLCFLCFDFWQHLHEQAACHVQAESCPGVISVVYLSQWDKALKVKSCGWVKHLSYAT